MGRGRRGGGPESRGKKNKIESLSLYQKGAGQGITGGLSGAEQRERENGSRLKDSSGRPEGRTGKPEASGVSVEGRTEGLEDSSAGNHTG